MQTLERVYQKNQNFVFRQIDDETLLVPIKDSVGDLGKIYSLNPVAAFIWKHLDGKKPLQEIKHLITNEFEVSETDAEQDLTGFVDQLQEIDAIWPTKPSTSEMEDTS